MSLGHDHELDAELATFQRELPRLLEEGHEGKYALIQGDRVDSLWPDEDAAYEAGCERFGLGPFLVQQVLRHEPVVPLFSDVPG
ncbi:MAG TPA: hypothetical protein VJ739_13940 [Gemmataceae bacterium]|nr:hypothetical protein [Gemmataceae bacterium]